MLEGIVEMALLHFSKYNLLNEHLIIICMINKSGNLLQNLLLTVKFQEHQTNSFHKRDPGFTQVYKEN